MDATTGPARSSRVRDAVAVAVLGCAAIVFTWPVLSRPGSGVYIGATVQDAPWTRYLANDPQAVAPATTGWGALGLVDTLRGIYTIAWWSHALVDGTPGTSWYDANVLHPTRGSLAYADLQLGVVPWFAPVWAATRNPILAYQLAQLAGVLGCALGFYVLLRSWSGSAVAGMVAGLASIVAPFRVGSASLLYLHFLLYLPWALVCVDAIVDGRRPVAAACGLFACLALQASSSGYLTFLTFLLVPAYALGVLVERGRRLPWRAVAALAIAGVVAAAAVVWLYRPFVEHAAAGAYGAAAPDDGSPAHNPWLVLLWDRPWLNLRHHLLGNVGMPMLVLAVLGVLHAGVRRRWTMLAIVGVGAVLALGPTLRVGPLAILLPWDWLARVVPGFTVQRQTYVTSNLVGVGMICLAGLGAAWLVARARTQRAWAAGLIVLAAVAAGTYDWRLAPPNVATVASGSRVPPVYGWLAAHGDGQPLLELPASLPTNAVFAYFSTRHWLPIFNGTYSYPPPGYTAALAATPGVLASADEAAAFVRAVPVRWVLVHGDLLPPAERARLASPPAHLDEVARFGDDVVFRLRAAVE